MINEKGNLINSVNGFIFIYIILIIITILCKIDR